MCAWSLVQVISHHCCPETRIRSVRPHFHYAFAGFVRLFLAMLPRAIAAAAATLSSGIIFPLYIYPGDSCSEWAPILDACVRLFYSTLR